MGHHCQNYFKMWLQVSLLICDTDIWHHHHFDSPVSTAMGGPELKGSDENVIVGGPIFIRIKSILENSNVNIVTS